MKFSPTPPLTVTGLNLLLEHDQFDYTLKAPHSPTAQGRCGSLPLPRAEVGEGEFLLLWRV